MESEKESNRDSSPELVESSERCSTPVPADEDVWEDLLTSALDGSETGREQQAQENGKPQDQELETDDSEPHVPRLCGLVIDVLRMYYEEGPEACRKNPDFENFYNYVDSLPAEECQPDKKNPPPLFDARSGNCGYLSPFVHPEAKVPKPPDHNGYRRVLDESIWQTDDSEAPFDEVTRMENPEQEISGDGQRIDDVETMECLEPQIIARGRASPLTLDGKTDINENGLLAGSEKPGGASTSFLPKRDARPGTSQKSVPDLLAVTKQNCSNVPNELPESGESVLYSPTSKENNVNPSTELKAPHEVGAPDPKPGLPNHPQEPPEPPQIPPEKELCQTEKYHTEFDKNCLTEPEIDDWYEELDYDL